MQIIFGKEIGDEETKYPPPIYFNCNTQTVINDSGINDSLETSYQIIFSRIEKWLEFGSGWLIAPVDDNCINKSVHNLLAGRSYV